MQTDVVNLVLEAQNDSSKLNELIENFLPFIKSCVAKSRASKQSQEDALTLAMITFVNCVKTYRLEKGAFISFVQTSIRNRLIDDFRAEQRFVSHNVPLLEDSTSNNELETKLSVEEYQYQLERMSLQLEIAEVSGVLELWNTSFAELAKICPKQKRTRAQCEYIATLLLKNEVWQKQLLEKRRMPSKEMCDIYGVSIKILDKYRKYIVTLCVIQSGDYPMLRSFLPINRKGGIGNE